jgi:hypothetical protein
VFLTEILDLITVIEDFSRTRCLPIGKQALPPPVDYRSGYDCGGRRKVETAGGKKL